MIVLPFNANGVDGKVTINAPVGTRVLGVREVAGVFSPLVVVDLLLDPVITVLQPIVLHYVKGFQEFKPAGMRYLGYADTDYYFIEE